MFLNEKVASKATRGFGLLEGPLSRWRGNLADRLIPLGHRQGGILDVGCGAFPAFLVSTRFSEKYGLDQLPRPPSSGLLQEYGIHYISHNIEQAPELPFPSGRFDIVTLLAVLEHIEPGRLPALLLSIHRILKPGGMCLLTTPAPWADPLLKVMAKLRLVSPEEIEEHIEAYSPRRILSLLEKASFSPDKMRLGYFEFLMNTWATATK